MSLTDESTSWSVMIFSAKVKASLSDVVWSLYVMAATHSSASFEVLARRTSGKRTLTEKKIAKMGEFG